MEWFRDVNNNGEDQEGTYCCGALSWMDKPSAAHSRRREHRNKECWVIRG